MWNCTFDVIPQSLQRIHIWKGKGRNETSSQLVNLTEEPWGEREPTPNSEEGSDLTIFFWQIAGIGEAATWTKGHSWMVLYYTSTGQRPWWGEEEAVPLDQASATCQTCHKKTSGKLGTRTWRNQQVGIVLAGSGHGLEMHRLSTCQEWTLEAYCWWALISYRHCRWIVCPQWSTLTAFVDSNRYCDRNGRWLGNDLSTQFLE